MRMILHAGLMGFGLAILTASAAQAANTCLVPGNASAVGEAVGQGVNSFRRSAGLRNIRADRNLTKAAQAHACDMAIRQNMNHTGSDGSNVQQRARREGYRDCLIAENIGYGRPYETPDAIVNAWANSQGHRFNMALQNVKDYGVGVAMSDRGPYWVLVLAKGC